MKKTAKSFTLGDDSLARLKKLTSDYGLRSLSAGVENCIFEMPTPKESKMFDALFDRLYDNYSKLAEMVSRRNNIIYRFALLFNNLCQAGSISKEDYLKAFKLFGDFGTAEDVETEAFIAAVPTALKQANYRTTTKKK